MSITSTYPVLGFLGIFINASSYITLYDNNTSFILQADPGKAPHDATDLTSPHITEASVDTTSHVNNTKPSVNFKSSLSLWLQITPWKYPATLKDPITKFRRCTPIKLTKHLWDKYGTITSQDLNNNYNRMTAQWNIRTPIEDLFSPALWWPRVCNRHPGNNLWLSASLTLLLHYKKHWSFQRCTQSMER